MYYFLAIVAGDDCVKGTYVPSYILCRSHGTKSTRSGLRVYKPKRGRELSKVLFRTLYGNEPYIDFLCAYRTRDHMHGSGYKHERTKKYYPAGALCYFPCNKYGDIAGPAIFIKKVPDKTKKYAKDSGFLRLKAFSEKPKRLSEVLSENVRYYSPLSEGKRVKKGTKKDDSKKSTGKRASSVSRNGNGTAGTAADSANQPE